MTYAVLCSWISEYPDIKQLQSACYFRLLQCLCNDLVMPMGGHCTITTDVLKCITFGQESLFELFYHPLTLEHCAVSMLCLRQYLLLLIEFVTRIQSLKCGL